MINVPEWFAGSVLAALILVILVGVRWAINLDKREALQLQAIQRIETVLAEYKHDARSSLTEIALLRERTHVLSNDVTVLLTKAGLEDRHLQRLEGHKELP